VITISTVTYPSRSVALAYRQKTPLLRVHLPVTGSGGARLMYGGSSRNVILRWNFSGTPWGGLWVLPGHTISLMSSPSSFHDFHTPICGRQRNKLGRVLFCSGISFHDYRHLYIDFIYVCIHASMTQWIKSLNVNEDWVKSGVYHLLPMYNIHVEVKMKSSPSEC
jgi:hypothetical protein